MLGDLAKPAGVEATLALGEGTLVIQLWASWCQNCSTITPKVADAVAAAAKPGVRFLTVSIDDERSDALGYVRKHSALFDGRNLERYHDPAAQVFKQFGLQGIPATVVLHRNGSHQILYGATDLEKLKATID
jgi:thioredoxin-like negative regulator of GroEL